MASLPSQRPASSQRRSASPPADSSSQAEQIQRSNSLSASIDSQTLLLNSPPARSSKPADSVQDTSQTHDSSSQPDAEPRRCWICFTDETEDEETTSEWRSPCPCVLVAHERCLLDWIADMEAPSARRRAGENAGKILCPQCKSEIRLERPKSLVVETVRLADKITGSLLVPGLIFVVGAAAYAGLSLAGEHTIYQIFGPEDGVRILAPLYQPPTPEESSALQRVLNHVRHNWRLDVGLPIIPTALIASRTTIADSVLPFLPLVFFASSTAGGDDLLQLSWPPSAAFTVAALPYLRGVYNTYYQRVWAPYEKRWLKEVQPRSGTEGEQEVQDNHEHDHAQEILHAIGQDEDEAEDEDHVGMNLEIDFEILGDWDNGGADAENNNNDNQDDAIPAAAAAAPAAQAPNQNPPLHMDNDDAEAAPAPAPQIPRNRPNPQQQPAAQPPQRRRQRQRNERVIGFSPLGLADNILGALLFPSIAALVGEALKHALPKSWTTPPAFPAKPTGFLQNRWGRSIVGGCLFVGVKDAVMLYVRWRILQNHRRRRVLDYEGSKGKKAGRGVV
ncbi:hypothetical protein DM02DRAFT_512652 [Periconia macrospinosa]|uniref:RING-CH-type domain-containing protein n=1 Tax=Periconia macrospinosa TaxID=97972 RepID=A0A2V1E9U0_9PLEO|nr:hypothetical protein DM02DRAFT_512652 [Periconia macrospinosa]